VRARRITIIDALRSKALLGGLPAFKDLSTWRYWLIVLPVCGARSGRGRLWTSDHWAPATGVPTASGSAATILGWRHPDRHAAVRPGSTTAVCLSLSVFNSWAVKYLEWQTVRGLVLRRTPAVFDLEEAHRLSAGT
jgi:hypothetical protein